ncbi:unnamed protein product [Mesocestoides corti]|uniref:Uncharacterized protein n=1 Tax=Mesocestoides corti TaxID=53468 RepID=A0A3P6I3Y9_MESCO|nr:unnamed protein product [Mesocestoides corti]
MAHDCNKHEEAVPPKFRLTSETTEPVLTAANLHQKLLKLQLDLNSLYAERHQLKENLDATILHRENLLAKIREIELTRSSTPPKRELLADLQERLSQEMTRSSSLLTKVRSLKEDVLPAETRGKLQCLLNEHLVKRKNCIDLCLAATEAQITSLTQHKSQVDSPEVHRTDPLAILLQAKNRLCDSLREHVAHQSRLLLDKGEQVVEIPSTTSDESSHQIRLRVLRFGLEERRKALAGLTDKAAAMTAKLNSLKVDAFEQKTALIRDLTVTVEAQRQAFRQSRQQAELMRSDVNRIIATAAADTPDETIDEVTRKADDLTAKVNSLRCEISRLDQQPSLMYRQLELANQEVEKAITAADEQCIRIKSRIRKRHKQLKSLRPKEAEVSAVRICAFSSQKINKLDNLNHRLSEVQKRLEYAENLDRRTQEVLTRQELRVEDVRSKCNRVKELYAEEKRAQVARVREIEKERDEYKQKLMELNKTLDMLGRHSLLKGARGAYKLLMADFDELGIEGDDEVDEHMVKRCAFFCQEIKRLQQHTAWLEENLKFVESKSLTSQRISAIKAVLDRGGPRPAANDVRRRAANRVTRPRPISMIETCTPGVTPRPRFGVTFRPSTVTASRDTRRRTLNEQLSASREPTVTSATQRRLEYSRSLRERHTFPRQVTPLPQRSQSFRQSVSVKTPLIFTAFRNTKFTASKSFNVND